MVFQLDNMLWFPKTSLADEDGFLAVCGDLSTERLLLAYKNGIFPWYNQGEAIRWYSPHQRFVLLPNEIKISKSMQQVLRSLKFNVTYNTEFKKVITLCANTKRNQQNDTWIIPDMQAAYLNLHVQGYAHSVEVWCNGVLVGGLYGVIIGKVFIGESMFSLVNNASKIALIWVCKNLTINLIDCQMHTKHLETMGAKMISRDEYMRYF